MTECPSSIFYVQPGVKDHMYPKSSNRCLPNLHGYITGTVLRHDKFLSDLI